MKESIFENFIKGDRKKRREIIKNLDNQDFLNVNIFDKISDVLFNNREIDKELKDDLYLFVFIIQNKDDMRTDIFENISNKYSNKFILIFKYFLNEYMKDKTSYQEKEIIIQFLLTCFQHLDLEFIYKEINSLNSIFTWVNLTENTLIRLVKKDISLYKKIIALSKLNKMENHNTINSINCRFLNNLIEEFLIDIEEKFDNLKTNFYMKIISLLLIIISISTMRKFILPLLIEKHFIERLKLIITKYKINSNSKLFSLYEIFSFYYFFDLKDNNIYPKFSEMQELSYSLFPEEMTTIFTDTASFKQSRENLIKISSGLTFEQLYTLLKNLGLIHYPENFYEGKNNLLKEIFISQYEKKENMFNYLLQQPLYPTESLLFSTNILPYDFSILNYEILPLPKINFSYLNIYDYLFKNFYLFKYESAYEIRNDLDDCIEKMNPEYDSKGNFKKFNGWSLMGFPIKNFNILSIKSPLVGQDFPSQVLCEIEYNFNGIQTEIKYQWDSLKKNDVIFLISLSENSYIIRGGEILYIYDDENNNILLFDKDEIPSGFSRRMTLILDPIQYNIDLKNEILGNLKFDFMLRRNSKENNFKSILETIKDLVYNMPKIPNWIEDPLLSKIHKKEFDNKNIILNDINFDFYDTFLNQNSFTKYIKEKEIKNSKIKCSLLKNKKEKSNKLNFTNKQLDAIISGVNYGLSLIVGPPGTGKTDIVVQIINLLYHNYPNEKILIVTHSNAALNDIFEKIINLDIDEEYLLRLGRGSKQIDSIKDFSAIGRIKYLLNKREELLDLVLKISQYIKIYTFEQFTCFSAINVLSNFINEKNNIEKIKEVEKKFNINLNDLINKIKELEILEIIRDQNQRRNQLIKSYSKIIALTCTYAAMNRKNFLNLNFKFTTLIMEESAQILDIESFIPLTLQKNISNLKRFIMLGDPNQLPPIVKGNIFRTFSNFDNSLFTRLIKNKVNHIYLDQQGRGRKEIVDIYRWKYPLLKDIKMINEKNNSGFLYNVQFINVDEFEGKGECLNSDYSYYNLAEAEYSIGIFMYMCLIGYDPKKISIITSYNGQKDLIKEIYNKKCFWNNIFSGIKKICTIDKYQGQQNDYIILSLVRTVDIGYLRDIRRLIVSLSRARLGLYILGKWDLFNNEKDIENCFRYFKNQEKNLKIYLDNNTNNIITIEDFKHMFRIVQELLKIKFS